MYQSVRVIRENLRYWKFILHLYAELYNETTSGFKAQTRSPKQMYLICQNTNLKLALLSSVIGNDPNVNYRIDYLPLPEGVCFILALLSSVIGNEPNVNCRISSLYGNST